MNGMKTRQEQAQILTAAVGEYVRLVNRADVEGGAGITIHVYGKLSFSADEGVYSVTSEDLRGNGTNSIAFGAQHLTNACDGESVFRQPSGILEITIN